MSQTGGIGVSRVIGTGTIPVWQGIGKDIQLAQGGFNLVKTGLVAGQILPAGSPMIYDEATRLATYVHTGIMYSVAASNAVVYNVKKGHGLIVGDYLATGAVGTKAYAITAIDTTTSSAYDILTVGTTIGAAAAGDVVYASTATGATASALAAINGLLYEETEVGATYMLNSVSIVIRGTVYARRIPVNAAMQALTALDDIIFSSSK
jgi:hypothetical protein